ncbi:NAD(P)H-dependent amine dehydrogenase family protein [Antrihabitans cavernicola]|uniref:Dihydrodipicolinate reductase n=1 Tax=Antrihabitans cavernicola TaxID=2495913 RepID=A0A5A7SBF0_9NOCA|nr:dihydrodipicolinate reductase [Spelaeibacter cavernicola]KAA0021903.1 dihydrodipicolinate reductase [Spelaeibacter cavernicola]
MAQKVIVWGTGVVGKLVIRELLDHPQFELAGVIVHDSAKDGVDVGELIGGKSAGIAATTDVAAALALDADAVAYFGPTAEFAVQNIENMSAALRSGKHVVSTSMTPLVYPKPCPPGLLTELEKACADSGKACFTTGIDPGFANDLFPMTLMGVCGRVDSVRIQELLDYANYAGDYSSTMGIGAPVEQKAVLEYPEILVFAWGHTIPMIADAVGVELDRIDTSYEKWAATEPIEFPHGVIQPGHCAAVRFEIRGWVGGEAKIVIEHVNRITNAAAPDWPRASSMDNDVYRVEIKGSPNIVQETAFRNEGDDDPIAGGCLATGMRAINAIPYLDDVDAKLVTALDLPLIPGSGTIRSVAR